MRQIPIIKGKDVLFRTYNFGKLMGSITRKELTKQQTIDLDRYMRKPTLTENQIKERDRLIKKRDSPPQLDDTGNGLIIEIFNELVRGIKPKEVHTKPIEKGNLVEDSAINRIAKVNGWGSFLNANKQGIELRDHIGIMHPDTYNEFAKTEVIGFDAKASYDGETFPFFDDKLKNKMYEWQAKRSAMIAGVDIWPICYSLENTPEHLIIEECKSLWRKRKLHLEHGHLFNNDIDLTPLGDVQKSFVNEMYERHNFDHLADWERVKTFVVKLEEKDRKLIEERAKLGRDKFDSLMEDYLLKEKYHS